jgi:ribosomal protein S18 acetylase RimI-like enzyme
VTIRPARPDDGPAMYDVCLRTGANGGDATSLYRDPRLLGEVYVGPYLALEPDLAFVVADDDDAVGGYVLGARDTADFERRCEETWWPPLRDRYPLDGSHTGADGNLVRLLHQPPRADPAVIADYPSHLHVDLLPGWQGGGWGRHLLETLFRALTRTGSSGVHLGVARRNERAIGFYRRMGFTELDGDEGGLTMGRRLR